MWTSVFFCGVSANWLKFWLPSNRYWKLAVETLRETETWMILLSRQYIYRKIALDGVIFWWQIFVGPINKSSVFLSFKKILLSGHRVMWPDFPDSLLVAESTLKFHSKRSNPSLCFPLLAFSLYSVLRHLETLVPITVLRSDSSFMIWCFSSCFPIENWILSFVPPAKCVLSLFHHIAFSTHHLSPSKILRSRIPLAYNDAASRWRDSWLYLYNLSISLAYRSDKSLGKLKNHHKL